MLQKIKQLRKILHCHPELSGNEAQTAQLIKEFIQQHHPSTKFIEGIGGHGLAAVYDFGSSPTGKTIVIRCELDALPIDEKNAFAHRSIHKGISHKCGHDGHMAIVAGLVFWIKEQTFEAGKIVLLFQPAEETGEGAYKVVNDPKFKNLQADYIFALHNLPGESMHSILTKIDSFSATVQSMTVHLIGKESHASEPENGINPTFAVAEIIQAFAEQNRPEPQNKDFVLLTPIHIHVGEKSYGISPAKGEIHYTLRTWNKQIMKQLEEKLLQIVAEICECHSLQFSFNWFEYFPTTHNNTYCNKIIQKATKVNKLIWKEQEFPLKFGEDFGWFSQEYKAAMFGLGAGLDIPALHHADYDFPDELIETGMKMFQSIITDILSI